ncbi:MAG: redoxin domain-containing protein [Candidatus Omnitrophica bacterium]|nr:redoxin domain-containing protein [Candidatus Omnitrophota bacterium]
MMKLRIDYKLTAFLIIALLLIGCQRSYALDEKTESASLKSYSRLELTSPTDTKELDYLGLTANRSVFLVSEIKADVIIVELVTAYCSYCEGKISRLNEVYQLVQKSPYSEKIKIIGVGMSNTERELNLFKEKYNIPFPLFADPENRIYTVSGRVDMPHWVVLKSDQNGEMKEIYSASRELPEPKAFLDMILEKSNI